MKHELLVACMLMWLNLAACSSYIYTWLCLLPFLDNFCKNKFCHVLYNLDVALLDLDFFLSGMDEQKRYFPFLKLVIIEHWQADSTEVNSGLSSYCVGT